MTTATPIARNPDVCMKTGSIPSGMQLIEGKFLMNIARSNKVPFGIATLPGYSAHRPQTVGLIIRDSDAQRMLAGIEKSNAAKLRRGKNADVLAPAGEKTPPTKTNE